MKNILIVLVCLFLSFQISAQTRQKDSHEHGAANLMLVIEGDKLQIGIEVPSESLIGFELLGLQKVKGLLVGKALVEGFFAEGVKGIGGVFLFLALIE